MATKRSTKKAPAKAGAISEIARDYGSVDAFLELYGEGTKTAVKRLFSNRAVREIVDSIGSKSLRDVAEIYELARSRGAWDQLSLREQKEWIKAFDKVLEKLFSLLDTAPRLPDEWGFPVRDYVLLEVAKRMGVVTPDSADPMTQFLEISRLENVADEVGWTIVDSLKHFQRQQHTDATVEQTLSKPRDAKAPRAFFLREFQRHNQAVSASTVATIASALFEEAVDERTVRAHRPTSSAHHRIGWIIEKSK